LLLVAVTGQVKFAETEVPETMLSNAIGPPWAPKPPGDDGGFPTIRAGLGVVGAFMGRGGDSGAGRAPAGSPAG